MKQIICLIIFFSGSWQINAQSIKQIKESFLSANTSKPTEFYLEPVVKVMPTLDKEYNCFSLPFGTTIFRSPVKLADYVSSLGVICRQELKLDKITPIPFRFRLGSLEYVNWMERKPNAVYNR